jgi:spore coat protein H
MVRQYIRILFFYGIIIPYILLCSCVEQIELQSEGPDDDSFEAVSLIIGRDNLAELLKATFIDRWFPIVIDEDSVEFNGRIRIHGDIARHYPKKTFKVEVYKGYPEKVADAFQLSAQHNDTSFCRYRLAHIFFTKAGFICSDVEPVHLYFDNGYHGIYLRVEMVDELFFQRRNLPVSSLYKAKTNSWFSTKYDIVPQAHFDKKLPEDDMTYSDLEQLFIILDQGVTASDTAKLSAILDIRNALDYYAVAILIKHYDGIVKNFYLYFNPLIQKFQFIPWDLDLTFYGGPKLKYNWANNLFEQLMAIDAYNSYIKSRMKELFNYEELTNVLDRLVEEIRSAVANDPWLKVEDRDFDGDIAGLQWYLSHLNSLLSDLK